MRILECVPMPSSRASSGPREMLKLKLQYSGHLIRRADSLEKTLMLGKVKGKRKRVAEDEMVGWYH